MQLLGDALGLGLCLLLLDPPPVVAGVIFLLEVDDIVAHLAVLVVLCVGVVVRGRCFHDGFAHGACLIDTGCIRGEVMGLCCGYDLVTDFALGILAGVGEVVRDRSNGGTAEITGSGFACRAVGSMICKVTGSPQYSQLETTQRGLEESYSQGTAVVGTPQWIHVCILHNIDVSVSYS